MEGIIDITRRSTTGAVRRLHCCFAGDESGYPVRDVDLRSTYPYFCITVNYAGLLLLRAALEERAAVLLRDSDLQARR